MKQISINSFYRFCRQTFAIGALFAGSVYLWVRILLHEIPFEWKEEMAVLMQLVLTSWVIIALSKAAFQLVPYIVTHRKQLILQLNPYKQQLAQLLAVIVIAGFLAGCNAHALGIKKDLNTGMVTNYSGLSAEDSKIIMNNEVLGHTDIPLGESFIIVNEAVKGLTVKNNKVSVGCSLTIADKSGTVLLSEPDLFKGNDVFEKDSISYLKCTVNTGQPMRWEENYTVTVVFTDKFGNGKIENKVTIRMIDIP
ncbi:MAG: hypothetical protein ACTHMM_11430 [Agriterribacter sp.]